MRPLSIVFLFVVFKIVFCWKRSNGCDATFVLTPCVSYNPLQSELAHLHRHLSEKQQKLEQMLEQLDEKEGTMTAIQVTSDSTNESVFSSTLVDVRSRTAQSDALYMCFASFLFKHMMSIISRPLYCPNRLKVV